MVNITIDGKKLQVEDYKLILDAARENNIYIPTLCSHEDLGNSGNCGICNVEIEGWGFKRACKTPVADGMKIRTRTPMLVEERKTLLRLILANHPQNCLHCIRNGNCELQDLTQKLNLHDYDYSQMMSKGLKKDSSSPSIVLDPKYCIKCGRCVTVCQDEIGRASCRERVCVGV